MASFIAFGGLVVAVLIVLFVLRVLYLRRKTKNKVDNSGPLDIYKIMDDIMERLPLSRGGHLWKVEVVDYIYRYIGFSASNRHCGRCIRKEEHKHKYPAIRVTLKDLMNEELQEGFTVVCFKWTYTVTTSNITALKHEDIVKAAVDEASRMPALYKG